MIHSIHLLRTVTKDFDLSLWKFAIEYYAEEYIKKVLYLVLMLHTMEIISSSFTIYLLLHACKGWTQFSVADFLRPNVLPGANPHLFLKKAIFPHS